MDQNYRVPVSLNTEKRIVLNPGEENEILKWWRLGGNSGGEWREKGSNLIAVD